MSDPRIQPPPERPAQKPPGSAPPTAPAGADAGELSARSPWRGLWRPALVIMLIALVVAIVKPGQIAENIAETRLWFRSQGLVGFVIFLGFYVIAAVCLVPQSALKIAAGAVFGSTFGIVLASAGSTLGAAACFLIARYVAHGSLLQRLKRKPGFERLDRMAGAHGAVMVAGSRLFPIFPGNLLNYAFGLTQVRTKTFVFWSWLCMLPGTVVLVVGTDAAVQGVEDGQIPWGLIAVIAFALIAMIAATRFAYLRYRERQPATEV